MAAHMDCGRCRRGSMWWRSYGYVIHSFTSPKAPAEDWIGILSACELFGRLAQDRAIPTVYLKVLPTTGAPFASILSFAAFCGLLYATAGGRLDVVSQMYA